MKPIHHRAKRVTNPNKSQYITEQKEWPTEIKVSVRKFISEGMWEDDDDDKRICKSFHISDQWLELSKNNTWSYNKGKLVSFSFNLIAVDIYFMLATK